SLFSAGPKSPAGSAKPEAIHQIVQRGTAHAQHLRRLAQVAVDAREHADDRSSLGLVPYLSQVQHTGAGILYRESDVFRADLRAVGHDDRALDDILELPHV